MRLRKVKNIRVLRKWQSSSLRVFLVGAGEHPQFTPWDIFRVMWKGTLNRVIVTSKMPAMSEFMRFQDGWSLHVTCRSSGNPIVYMKEDVVAEFSGCSIRNKWIPRMVEVGPDEWRDVKMFIELECDAILIKGDTE